MPDTPPQPRAFQVVRSPKLEERRAWARAIVTPEQPQNDLDRLEQDRSNVARQIEQKTGKPVGNPMTVKQARALTDRIKNYAEWTWDLIQRAYLGRAWVALGYESWDVYCIQEFGSARLRVPREERPEMVKSLREAGLSIRAIASATGLGRGTVEREVSPVPNGTPEPEVAPAPPGGLTGSSPGQTDRVQDIVDRVGRQAAEPDRAPATVVGIDGKQYTPPAIPKRDKPSTKPKSGERPGATPCSRKIQDTSAWIMDNCESLTDEQVTEALGAAQFLYELLRGEKIIREGREK